VSGRQSAGPTAKSQRGRRSGHCPSLVSRWCSASASAPAQPSCSRSSKSAAARGRRFACEEVDVSVAAQVERSSLVRGGAFGVGRVEGQRSQQAAAQPCPASTVAVGEWQWPFLAGDWPRALDASANVVRGGRRDLPSQSVRPSAPLFPICARVKTENMGDMTISRYHHRSLSVHAAMGERGWWKKASFPLCNLSQYGGRQRAKLLVCTSDCCIWPPQKANRPAQPDAGARRPRAYQHARAERAASHLKSDDGALAAVAGCGCCCPGRVHLLGNGMGVDLI
jgi:hypothetical protein